MDLIEFVAARIAEDGQGADRRTLRQVQAARSVLSAYELALAQFGEDYPLTSVMRGLVKAHAVVWEDHPDFRPEWTPGQ